MWHSIDKGSRGQESRHGTLLPMHEKLPRIAVRQIIFNTLQTVLSEQLPLLLLVLFSKIAGAETSPAPEGALQSLF